MPLQNIFAICLLTIVAGNFFIRGIHYFSQSKKIAFSKDTFHTFQCQKCNDRYQLAGQTAKKKISFAPKKENQTLGKSKTMYKFTCPNCGVYDYQEKIFDININKNIGLIRIKGDYTQTEIFKDFLIKGVIPTIVAVLLLQSFLF